MVVKNNYTVKKMISVLSGFNLCSRLEVIDDIAGGCTPALQCSDIPNCMVFTLDGDDFVTVGWVIERLKFFKDDVGVLIKSTQYGYEENITVREFPDYVALFLNTEDKDVIRVSNVVKKN